MKIDGNDGIDSARDRVAAGEYAAVAAQSPTATTHFRSGVAW
jgi:hypothetical protein